MMQALSILALFACSLIAWRWGGRDERLAAFGFVLAALLSVLANRSNYGQPEITELLVDSSLLLGLVYLALRSDRFWPIWAAAFQLVGTSVHFASMTETGTFQKAYANALIFWFYPVVVSLMIGTYLEARKRHLSGW